MELGRHIHKKGRKSLKNSTSDNEIFQSDDKSENTDHIHIID